ncbi:MAG: DNA repair protein RadC [Bacillota bacterium]|nr:DNA repair protein RadC [Bacillota bacterium]
MQIKDMPKNERPQEELLALIIRTGTSEKSAIQLAEDVLAYAMIHVGNLGMADARELTQVDGIGTAKACSIAAAFELSKRLISGAVRETGRKLASSEEVAALLMEEMMYERREVFMAINLNTKLEIESKSIISIGSLDSAPVHPREVFGPAIRRGAAGVIVAHNHPSGDPTPSNEDRYVTTRLEEAAGIIGIKLIDHVIIGNGKYTSMRQLGYLNTLNANN